MAEQVVTLSPGESKVVSFEATPKEVRIYQVSVDGLTGSFKATALIPLQLSMDFLYRPEEDDYFIEVRGTNRSSTPITFWLRIKGWRYGEPMDWEPFEVTLLPGETRLIIGPGGVISATLRKAFHSGKWWVGAFTGTPGIDEKYIAEATAIL